MIRPHVLRTRRHRPRRSPTSRRDTRTGERRSLRPREDSSAARHPRPLSMGRSGHLGRVRDPRGRQPRPGTPDDCRGYLRDPLRERPGLLQSGQVRVRGRVRRARVPAHRRRRWFDLAPLDLGRAEVARHLSSPGWRSLAFTAAVREDTRLNDAANIFQRGWLTLVYQVAFALAGLGGTRTPDQVHAALADGTMECAAAGDPTGPVPRR